MAETEKIRRFFIKSEEGGGYREIPVHVPAGFLLEGASEGEIMILCDMGRFLSPADYKKAKMSIAIRLQDRRT